MSEKYYLPWSDDRPSLVWSGGDVEWVWKDVYVLLGVAASIPEGSWLPDENPWDWLEKKVDKKILDDFEKIVIKVNGLEKIIEKDKKVKITVQHIKTTFDKFGIPVRVGVSFDKGESEE